MTDEVEFLPPKPVPMPATVMQAEIDAMEGLIGTITSRASQVSWKRLYSLLQRVGRHGAGADAVHTARDLARAMRLVEDLQRLRDGLRKGDEVSIARAMGRLADPTR